MWRGIFGVVAGLVAWFVIVTAINFGLRWWLPGYQEAEPTLVFTMDMKIARLAMAAVTSLLAGVVVGAVAQQNRWAATVVGAILLSIFVPVHISLWDKFPVWYHLSFLVPLLPLVLIGAALAPKHRTAPA